MNNTPVQFPAHSQLDATDCFETETESSPLNRLPSRVPTQSFKFIFKPYSYSNELVGHSSSEDPKSLEPGDLLKASQLSQSTAADASCSDCGRKAACLLASKCSKHLQGTESSSFKAKTCHNHDCKITSLHNNRSHRRMKICIMRPQQPTGAQESPKISVSPTKAALNRRTNSPKSIFSIPLFRLDTSGHSSTSRCSIESLQDNNGDDCRNDSKYDIDTVPDYERLLEENRQYMDFLESRKTIQSMEKVSLVPTSDEFCNRQVPRKVSIALKHPC